MLQRLKHYIGWFLGQYLVPAQTKFTDETKNLLRRKSYSMLLSLNTKNSDCAYKSLQLILYEESPITYLDGVMLIPKSTALQSDKQRIYIIRLMGNGHCYELVLEDMKRQAVRMGCTVVGYNYPGVMESTGYIYSSQTLIDSIHAIVKHVIEQEGANEENIFLDGHSLGASLALVAASKISHSTFVEADRPFAKFSKAIVANLGRSKSNRIMFGCLMYLIPTVISALICKMFLAFSYLVPIATSLGVILGTIEALAMPKVWHKHLYSIVKKIISVLDWELDATQAISQLDTSRVHFSVIKDDEIIPYHASLHYQLEKNNSNHYLCDEFIPKADYKDKYPWTTLHSLQRYLLHTKKDQVNSNESQVTAEDSVENFMRKKMST